MYELLLYRQVFSPKNFSLHWHCIKIQFISDYFLMPGVYVWYFRLHTFNIWRLPFPVIDALQLNIIFWVVFSIDPFPLRRRWPDFFSSTFSLLHNAHQIKLAKSVSKGIIYYVIIVPVCTYAEQGNERTSNIFEKSS